MQEAENKLNMGWWGTLWLTSDLSVTYALTPATMNLSRHGRPSNVSGVKKGKQTIFQKIEGRKLNNKEYWAAI